MAIIVEEEKKNGGAGTSATLGWFIIVVIILTAAYYTFFASVPAVQVTPPANFQIIVPIAQITIDPSSTLGSPAFLALKSYISEPTSTGPIPVGKANPFLP
jgi:hypothetical protein